MGFISLERQVSVTGLFRKVSVLTEAQGLWHIPANRNGDGKVKGSAKYFGSYEWNALVRPQQPGLSYKQDTTAS